MEPFEITMRFDFIKSFVYMKGMPSLVQFIFELSSAIGFSAFRFIGQY